MLRDTHSFSALLFQEFRVSFHRQVDLLNIPQNHTSLSSLGLDGIVPDNPALEGPPRVVITGISAFGNAYNPRSNKRNNYQLVDNVSYVRGRHNLKFGGEFRKYYPNILNSCADLPAVRVLSGATQSGKPASGKVARAARSLTAWIGAIGKPLADARGSDRSRDRGSGCSKRHDISRSET